MIIERKFNKAVPFGSLNPGDCFGFDCFVYIKMKPTGMYSSDNEYILHNAFWVDESKTFHFGDDEKVIPLNMKLVEI